MRERSDAELVDVALAGQTSAFDELVRRYGGMALRVARRAVEDDDLAAELVQEAMVKAYLSLSQIRRREQFQSWLHGIVLNVCRTHRRGRRDTPLPPEWLEAALHENGGFSYGLDPQVILEGRELHQRAAAAMSALSEKDRAAAHLFYFEQMSLREIAAALDVSVSAVKVRLHKARKQLRERLQPYGPAPIASLDLKPGEPMMVQVKVEKVLESKSEIEGQEFTAYCILLREEAGNRALVIWVGLPEATAISMRLHDITFRRPMTYYFVSNLLEAAGAKIETACIADLREETFYAVARVRSGKGVKEVDARPSDVIALALHAGCPILVAEDVMKQVGFEVPDGEDAVTILTQQAGREFHRLSVEIRQQVFGKAPVPEEGDEEPG